jgi:hypothetical protein
MKNEIIFKASAAGGSVTLYGVRTNHGWRFTRQVIDQTPNLIDEPWIQHKSEVVDSWQAALELMDRYHWHTLFPREVHSEFRELVWAAVVSRYVLVNEKDHMGIAGWEHLCGVSNEHRENKP